MSERTNPRRLRQACLARTSHSHHLCGPCGVLSPVIHSSPSSHNRSPFRVPPQPKAPGDGKGAPPHSVWLSGSRGAVPVQPPVRVGHGVIGPVEGHANGDDRKWISLDASKDAVPTTAARAHSMLSAPLQTTEAELLELRMRSLLDENKQLREALREKKSPPDESTGSPDAQLLKLLQDQRNDLDKLRLEKDQITAKLEKAENNLDRKVEMIEILRVQLDEADLRSSKQGANDEERMKNQEALMEVHAQLEQVKKERDEERALKERAWTTLLKVEPEKMEALENKLEDERLNAKEMLEEIRALREEKDAAAAANASMIRALTDERDMLKSEINQARSGSESLQHERVDALEKLQNLREDYANLDFHVNQSKADNEALMLQLKFLTQQLQARQNQQQAQAPTVSAPHDHEIADPNEQARFYEQQATFPFPLSHKLASARVVSERRLNQRPPPSPAL